MKIKNSNNRLKVFSAIFLCTTYLRSPAIVSTTNQFKNTLTYQNWFRLNIFEAHFARTHFLMKSDLNINFPSIVPYVFWSLRLEGEQTLKCRCQEFIQALLLMSVFERED